MTPPDPNPARDVTPLSPDEAVDFHDRVDAHRHESKLAEVILGGQDGLVNVLGVILGVAAATHETRVVVVAGLAATFAESISMAAVAYTAALADHARYESERAREHRHVRRVPDLEREEIRAIYRLKGFEGELLERIVAQITADPEVWVAVMLSEELRLTPVTRGSALRRALVVGVAALIGSLLPLAPFLLLGVKTATWVALGLGAVTLFAVGSYKALTTVGHWLKAGLEMAVIGTVSALGGYLIGMLMSSPSG